MRLRILAALAAAVLIVGVLPAAAQDSTDSGGALGEGLPTDGLPTGALGGGGDGGADGQDAAAPTAPAAGGFIATADGGALDIRLAGQSLTVGHSEVGLQSAMRASACDQALVCSQASGEALLGESAEVTLTQSGASDSDSAAALELDQLEPLLSASVGTASVDASTNGDATSANAAGGVLSAEVSLTEGLVSELPQGQVTGQLQNLLSSLQGAAGGSGGSGGAGNLLDGLTSQLDPMLGNLDAGQIQGILSGSGLPLAASASASTSSTSPADVAQELIQRNAATAQPDGDSSGGSSDSGGDTGNDDSGSGGLATQGLLDAVTGGGQDGGDSSGGSGGADSSDDAEGGLAAGAAPSPEAVTTVIEDALGGADTGQTLPANPTGLAGRLTATVQQLINDLTSGSVASVRVGPTSSQASDGGGSTSAGASSQGAQVVLLPTSQSSRENPEGLATVEVGSASASVDSSRTDASADFDPAVARVRIASPLAEGGVQEITVRPGQSECAGVAPLRLCVSVGNGHTTTDGAGAAASANAVSISALGSPLPELSIDLAAATAGVNSAAEVEQQEQPEQPEQPAEPTEAQADLPRTGGGALVPGLLLLGAGAAGFAGLRRRR